MIARLIVLILILFSLAACQLSQSGTPTETPTLIPIDPATPDPATASALLPTATPSPLPPTETPIVAPAGGSADVLLGGVLAWIGGRDVVNRAGRTAQMALIASDGTVSTLFETADSGRPARACGERALSPNGDLFAFFVGGDRGALYVMRGAAAPVMLREVEYLACLGLGTFAYSADGGRFAFIDYAAGASRAEFAAGDLRVYDAAALTDIASLGGVVAFDLGERDALYLRFYANEQGIADEAAALLWDGETEREIATLLPTQDGCRFTSGQIVRGGADEPALILLGQRCTRGDTRTFWQLYTLDSAAGAVTLVQSDAQPGAFVTFARTNALIPSPDGETVYFTVPDGVAAFTTAIAAIARPDLTITIPVGRQAVLPNFSGNDNATPRFSPDGRWLTFVITSPDGDNLLAALELDSPERAPLTLNAGSRGDTIPAFDYGLFSDRVYLIAGGRDNALYDFDLNTGASRRIARGTYVEALAASRDELAVVEVRRADNRDLYDLVLVSAADGTKRTIFTAEPVPGGGSTIAVPLLWR